MKMIRRLIGVFLAVLMFAAVLPSAAFCSEVTIVSDKIARGKTGKSVSISFEVKNNTGHDIENLAVGFDTSGGEIWDEDEEDREYGYAFPFEVTGSLHDTENPKKAGKLGKGDTKKVSISGYVRRDLNEGYYKVPVVVMEGDDGSWNWLGAEDLKLWVTRSSSTDDDDDDEIKSYDFVVGEGQSTPVGRYPQVCNFSINLRNNSAGNVYNVKASIVPDADTDKFPFEINDVNYDRMFEKIGIDETVSLDYSFAVREKAYSGYYLVPLNIYYSDSSTGEELTMFETSFYVHIFNKDREDELGDFNEYDREKARIIVDGFFTDPETIIAGDEFELVLNMKNASNSISATNILFSMESEKVSDSAVFTTESGSSSVAVDAMKPGETKEIRMRLSSKPGVDQRSYGLTVKAKYDSPEFKNAEENITVDIPVRQIARLNTGTFEIMPSSINVGEEANVMFPINNTGKVILYNVMVRFEADSVQTAETYVGNIKPGESGNVDCMLIGTAPTMDDGSVKVLISYEDENGTISSEEKSLILFVSEEMTDMDEMNMEDFPDDPAETAGFVERHPKMLLLAAAVVILLLAGVIVVLVMKENRRKKALETDLMDDEE
ncbi:MAG: COG1361 S-layer family protein [Brotaphodocola sp.]